MPNTLDMGGFAEAGLRVAADIRGNASTDAASAGTSTAQKILAATLRGFPTFDVSAAGGLTMRLRPGNNNPVTTNLFTDYSFPGLSWTISNGNTGLLSFRDGYGFWVAYANNGEYINSGFQTGSASTLRWVNGSSGLSGTADLLLYRDAAGTLAQRNGTSAQTFRVYRSYTDASNYSRWTVKWNTSTAILQAEGAGTGTNGSTAFGNAALATNATVGFLMIPSCAGTPTGTPADIPTGQSPIVYDSTNKKLCLWDGAAWVQTAALT